MATDSKHHITTDYIFEYHEANRDQYSTRHALIITVDGIPANNSQLTITDRNGSVMNLVATNTIAAGSIENNSPCSYGGCAKVGTGNGSGGDATNNSTNRTAIATGIKDAINTHISNGSGTTSIVTSTSLDNRVTVIDRTGRPMPTVTSGVDFSLTGVTEWDNCTATPFRFHDTDNSRGIDVPFRVMFGGPSLIRLQSSSNFYRPTLSTAQAID